MAAGHDPLQRDGGKDGTCRPGRDIVPQAARDGRPSRPEVVAAWAVIHSILWLAE
jgi:hypothetical protein